MGKTTNPGVATQERNHTLQRQPVNRAGLPAAPSMKNAIWPNGPMRLPQRIGLVNNAVQRAEDRYNTFYTHMLTRPTSMLTGTPQGPHTVSHTIVSHGITQTTDADDWDSLANLFDDQVPHPDDIKVIILNEITPNNRQKFYHHLDRYYQEYDVLYGNIDYGLNEQEDGTWHDILAAIRELMEMHPYQTYAWKTGKAASKRATKPKKEGFFKRQFLGGDTSALKGLIDINRAKFRDQKGFFQFMRTRLLMVADDVEVNALLPDEEMQ